MITAAELLAHLQHYITQSPENGQAQIMLKCADDLCYPFAMANDARGMPGQHFLVFVPDGSAGGIGMMAVRPA